MRSFTVYDYEIPHTIIATKLEGMALPSIDGDVIQLKSLYINDESMSYIGIIKAKYILPKT